jgi:hypothetical protein
MSDLQLLLVAVLATTLSFIGCSSQLNPSDVVGAYTLRYPYGVEELVLRRDGTYEQSFVKHGETSAKKNLGRWELREGKQPEIVLRNCMLVDDFFGKPRASSEQFQPGDCILRVEKRFGRVSLPLNEDQGFIYKKKS